MRLRVGGAEGDQILDLVGRGPDTMTAATDGRQSVALREENGGEELEQGCRGSSTQQG